MELTAQSETPTSLNREQRRDTQAATAGFKPARKRYRLRFEGVDGLDGMQVTMRGLGVAEFFDLAEVAAAANTNPSALKREDIADMRSLFEMIAAGVVDWNLLDDNDQPVPVTVEGLLAQELDLVLALADAWMNAMVGVPGPLDQRSTGGAPSEVASLPMEPLSASQAS